MDSVFRRARLLIVLAFLLYQSPLQPHWHCIFRLPLFYSLSPWKAGNITNRGFPSSPLFLSTVLYLLSRLLSAVRISFGPFLCDMVNFYKFAFLLKNSLFYDDLKVKFWQVLKKKNPFRTSCC